MYNAYSNSDNIIRLVPYSRDIASHNSPMAKQTPAAAIHSIIVQTVAIHDVAMKDYDHQCRARDTLVSYSTHIDYS